MDDISAKRVMHAAVGTRALLWVLWINPDT